MSEEMQGAELNTVIHDEAPAVPEVSSEQLSGAVNAVEQATADQTTLGQPANAGVEGSVEPTASPATPLFAPTDVALPSLDEVNVPYVSIKFQTGPVSKNGYNGVQIEEVIEILIQRIEALNDKLPCQENETALQHLAVAKGVLNDRTAKRIAQGVEGTDAPHV